MRERAVYMYIDHLQNDITVLCHFAMVGQRLYYVCCCAVCCVNCFLKESSVTLNSFLEDSRVNSC